MCLFGYLCIIFIYNSPEQAVDLFPPNCGNTQSCISHLEDWEDSINLIRKCIQCKVEYNQYVFTDSVIDNQLTYISRTRKGAVVVETAVSSLTNNDFTPNLHNLIVQ